MADKTPLGVTPNGKHICAANKANRSVLELYFTEGGVMPDELSGAYSDRASALLAVNEYLARPFARAKRK
jgi:hypothetical protein